MWTRTLDTKEMLIAAQVGVIRQIENTKKARVPAHGQEPDRNYQDHIIGAMGEMVVAKALNLWWQGMFVFRGPDVVVQVRTADGLRKRLILHPSDKDDEIFVHVRTDGLGYFELVGWIKAKDGKRPEYWSDPTKKNRHAFFVPNDKLNDMDSIFDAMRDEDVF